MRRSWAFLSLLLLSLPAFAGDLDLLLHKDFDLLAWEGRANLASFLDQERPLILVLWNSQCPECLENVAQLEDLDLPALAVRLVGVNSDPARATGQGFVEERGITYPQLHDPEALLADRLDAAGTSFSYALLDGRGEILALRYDSVPDARADVTQALEALRNYRRSRGRTETVSLDRAAPKPRPGGEIVGTLVRYPVLQGEGRARLRMISLARRGGEGDGCEPAGPYGESLVPTRSLLYRLGYELRVRVAPGLSAGGKLRVSNEDPVILEQGPEYLGSPQGSVFAELRRGGFSGRLGYFASSFTPLTLQRWDFTDNPPAAGSGGASGCGTCGGATRGLSLEALDDLGEPVTFEGLSLAWTPRPWLDLEAFYAIPQRAEALDSYDMDAFAYRKDLLAGRMALRPLTPWGRGELSFQMLGDHEDGESSVHFSAADPASFIHKNEAWSLRLAGPLPADLKWSAERASSFSRVDRIDGEGQGESDAAALLELERKGEGWRLAAGWARLGARYASNYQALSYRGNAQGWRLSAELRGRSFGGALFLKDLARIEDGTGDMPASALTASGLVSWRGHEGLLLDLTGTLIREEDDDDSRCDRVALTLSARWTLARDAELQLDLSHLLGDGAPGGPARADLAVLQVTAGF